MKHTPGPWKIDLTCANGDVSEFHIFIEPGVAVIEKKVEGQDQHDMPNARLIAAAPDLLMALDFLLYASADEYPDAVEQAKKALEKATGDPQ